MPKDRVSKCLVSACPEDGTIPVSVPYINMPASVVGNVCERHHRRFRAARGYYEKTDRYLTFPMWLARAERRLARGGELRRLSQSEQLERLVTNVKLERKDFMDQYNQDDAKMNLTELLLARHKEVMEMMAALDAEERQLHKALRSFGVADARSPYSQATLARMRSSAARARIAKAAKEKAAKEKSVASDSV